MNPKVILGVAAAILLIYFFAPQLLKYSGLLVALICPLSMVLMMGMMSRDNKTEVTKKVDSKNT